MNSSSYLLPLLSPKPRTLLAEQGSQAASAKSPSDGYPKLLGRFSPGLGFRALGRELDQIICIDP